jgi:hypothetical protein
MDASTDTPFGYVLYNYEDEQSLGRKMPGEVIDSPVRELLIGRRNVHYFVLCWLFLVDSARQIRLDKY